MPTKYSIPVTIMFIHIRKLGSDSPIGPCGEQKCVLLVATAAKVL